MTEAAAVKLVADDTEGCVICLGGGRHRLIGRLTRCGVQFWCALCRQEHIVSWEVLFRLHGRLKPAVANALEESSGHSLAPEGNLR